MEKVFSVRINKNGTFHQGDLNRLNAVPGNVTNVVLPDVPRGGRATVVKDESVGFGVEPMPVGLEITRSPTFHP